MDDNPLNRIPTFDRVSLRAVVVSGDEHPSQALSEAGIFDPITLPLVSAENQSVGFGDGITPNLTAVLEMEQEAAGLDAGPPEPATVSRSGPAGRPRSKPTSLPAAYGLQTTAPVRRRGG